MDTKEHVFEPEFKLGLSVINQESLFFETKLPSFEDMITPTGKEITHEYNSHPLMNYNKASMFEMEDYFEDLRSLDNLMAEEKPLDSFTVMAEM